MAGKKIWVSAQVDYKKYCGAALKELQNNGFDIILNTSDAPPSKKEQLAVCKEIDGVIAGAEPWDREILEQSPKLEIISRFGIGIDNIDIKFCQEKGIRVTNVKDGNVEAVSDTAVCFILSAIKGIGYAEKLLKTGRWQRQFGHTLKSRKVGLLGFGNIARRVAEKLRGFGCEIYAYDKYPDRAAFTARDVKEAPFSRILQECDVISVHLPLTGETRGLISKEQLEMMKPDAVLINTARGGIVDERALYEALRNGVIHGAAVDVYECEPAVDNILFTLDNCICTPHMAGAAVETFSYIADITAKAVIHYFMGLTPDNIIV